jgi:hypothetical protein
MVRWEVFLDWIWMRRDYFRYEIVDSYRQYTDTYLPLRLDNYPRELWNNFRTFFKSDEATEEIDDEEP